MGQRTIGAFIAALRKANGLTQKDLAEKLNVSDKTVSRWERDEGTPDLSLIPVIAEIFGVTCDELLRGERKAPGEREPQGKEECATARGTKQRQRLLASSLTKYKNCSYIAMGVSLMGLVAAMILNLGFLYAIIGFCAALICLIAGVLCQIIFINNAFAAVAGIDEDEDLYKYKRSVVRLAEKSFGLDVFLLGVALPLLFIAAYLGLGLVSWLMYGLMSAAAMIVIYVVICWAVNAFLVKKGVLGMDEASQTRYWNRHRIQRKYGVRLCVVLVVFFIAQVGLNSADRTVFTSGTVFEEYDSFVAYMEEEASAENSDGNGGSGDANVITEEFESVYDSEDSDAVQIYRACTEGGDELFFDVNGDRVSEDYVNELNNVTFGNALTDSEGNLLCKWDWRNQSVVTIRYGSASDGYLPIAAYDDSSIAHAEAVLFRINVAFVVVYLGAFTITIIIYRKKRER